jgi:hypothetical protein
MAKLTEKERIGFESILNQDLQAIDVKFMNQIKDFWNIARERVMMLKGWDKLKKEKQELNKQKEKIIERIHEIENIMNKENLLPEQIVELGGKPDTYGRFGGANFYGIPVTSQFEYEIVEYIRRKINLEIPAKILRDIAQASIRELTMAGTFEEARESYEKFYSLDFRKYGVDIPPRLKEVADNKKLLTQAGQSLNIGQIEHKELKNQNEK